MQKYIAESSFADGKNQKRIIKYMGALTPAQIENYRTVLKAINMRHCDLTQLDDVQLIKPKNFLNVFVFHSLWKDLGLDNIFIENEKKDLSTGEVAEVLTLSKILKPSSVTKTIDWLNETYLPHLRNFDSTKYNRMKIFNELSKIDKCHERIEQKLIQISQQFNSGDFKIFFLDSTTTFFERTKCDLAKPVDESRTSCFDYYSGPLCLSRKQLSRHHQS